MKLSLSRRSQIIFILIFTLLIIVVSVFLMILFTKELEEGTFSNPYYFAGILSGIFSGLAFLGVVFSFYYQRQDSKLQRGTNDILRFETTFFNMLQLLQEIVDNLSFNYSHVKMSVAGVEEEVIKQVDGRKSFEIMYRYSAIHVKNDNHEDIVVKNGMKSVLGQYGINGFENAVETVEFDHYFRLIYRIIRFIDDDDKRYLTFSQRYEYASIVRATLSPYELVWIYYDGLSKNGNSKLKPYIQRYSMLKNLRSNLLTKNYSNKSQNSDYDYYLTDDMHDIEKYYRGAFCDITELNKNMI